MGPGSGKRAALACVLGALAIAAAGCGVEEHANNPRPQIPTDVSVSVTDSGITLVPDLVGIGDKQAQLPQNAGQPQPERATNAPLTVIFTVANQTATDTRLEVRGPGRSGVSGPMVAHGNGHYEVNLPTGVYAVSAADIPAAGSARLSVGPVRTSSENDVLLP